MNLKNYYLVLFCFVFTTIVLEAQEDIRQELPNVFKKYYRIKDKKNNKYWDMAGSTNIYGYPSYHGGDNQQWVIFPKIPNSEEFVIVSKKDAKIVDRHHSNNLYGQGHIHLGGNQIFKMEEITPSYYTLICSDTYKAIDRCLSGRNKDPFKKPSKDSDNLYCTGVHNGTNQQFKFDELGFMPNYQNYYFTSSSQKSFPGPAPQSITDAGEDKRHNEVLRSRTLIPFFLVNDNELSNSYKLKYSPYYIFKEYEYFKLDRTYTIGDNVGYVSSMKVTNGIKKSRNIQTKKTVSMTYSAEGKIGIPITEAIKFDLGLSIQSSRTLEVSQTDYSEYETEFVRTTEWTKISNEAQRVFVYKRILRFEVWRGNESYLVDSWEVVMDEDETHLTYPTTDIIRDNTKAANINPTIHKYIQSEPINRIPTMTSNSKPSGTCSASSVYSSTYQSYQAFDNESNGWTLWISGSHRPYREQYLQYEFDHEGFMYAYNITPQTGRNSDRSPKNWILKGWNGSTWVNIDTRSNVSESFWVSNPSRNFNIQKPGRFKKYRLCVTSVNGSSVVSLRSFKLFGENISLNKSANIKPSQSSLNFNSEVDSKAYDFDFKILPNPNSGSFRLEFLENKNSKNIVKDNSSFNNPSAKPITYKIYSMKGILVYSSELDHESSVIKSNLNKGIYVLVLKYQNNTYSKKFIVK